MIELSRLIQHIIFNLVFNSGFSFLAGLLIVTLVLKIFQVELGRLRLALLSLPFIKILWDLGVRGLPASSIIFTGIDPFSLPEKSQTITLGAGVSKFGPGLNAFFSAHLPTGEWVATSIADYAFFWLSREFFSGLPLAILTVTLAISFGLVLRRIFTIYQFEGFRKKDPGVKQLISVTDLGFRSVEMYCSDRFAGSPFTGGVLNPYICWPSESYSALNDTERATVNAHELSHVRSFDVVFSVGIQLLGDFFWFVPGYRWLAGRIDTERELIADEKAVAVGADRKILAHCLVKLHELRVRETHDKAQFAFSAFFRKPHLIRLRVSRLLADETGCRGRFGWNHLLVRALVVMWTCGAVAFATLGGNHEVVPVGLAFSQPVNLFDLFLLGISEVLQTGVLSPF